MTATIKSLKTLGFVGAVMLIALMGWLKPIDNALRDLRFSAGERLPTGGIVFLDIDTRTLDAVGVWPWPRRIHAEITDRLMGLGAADVAFDIDFSTASNETDDALFEAALERAGGYVMLAALRQPDDAQLGAAFNLPIPRFRQYASPVTVNIEVEGSGVVRSYPYGLTLGGVEYPSLASALSLANGPADASFHVDFSIDPAYIDRISVADLLAGTVEPARIENRQVVVGASALELRDTFVVPRQGVLPGGMVQILAAETLRQGRALAPLGFSPPFTIIVLIGIGFMLLRDRIRLPDAIGGAVILTVCIEAAALWLQIGQALLFDTAAVHVAQVAFVLEAIGREVGRFQLLHAQATRERDATRIILDHVIADNFDGVVVVDERGRIVAASRLAEDLLGGGLRGRMASEALPDQLDAAVEMALGGAAGETLRRPAEALLPQPDGELRDVEFAVTISAIEAGAADRPARRVACLTFRDVTERRRNEEKLLFLAGHDPLTGALSRLKLTEIIDVEMADDRSRAAGLTVIMLDLSRFKTVNDTLGHSYGDMVLKQVVGRIQASNVDAVARLGGDSFALLLKGRRTDEDLQLFCAGLLQRIAEPYRLGDRHQAIVAASAGGTHSALSGYDAEVLLSHADMALAAAKAMPGSRLVMFTAEMDDRLKEKRDMELALGQAIEREEFSLCYQPQIALDSGELVGVEALIRWEHPTLGVVAPDKFIPTAEETGQIIELGRWVLKTACREIASWPFPTRLAVNVSPIQFELADVVGEVASALALSGLPAHRLDVEITEGIFMSNAGLVIDSLQRLRDLGVGIALDDFGTGYSSLSYLGRLPVDKIKIDKSFVRSLPGDAEAGAIIRAVMTLSETLNKVVIAEGIENADQAWMLRMMGCRIGQGYHFGRPRRGAEMARWFEERAETHRSLAG
ncbi:MAG: EAL domain-containing protein [Devosia sp.]